ncbi:MAG: hypothetical protein EA364_13460 [Balneolaceae bacterium]|nr:MAG: hypothetical protein EA364_13460 [Balneolaceae bacterium]
MKSLNLQRFLTLITTCSLLAAMVVRTAHCGTENCPMQAAEMKKSGCCSSMASAGGKIPQDDTARMIPVVPDFTFASATGSGGNCHGSETTKAVPSPGTDAPVKSESTAQPGQSGYSDELNPPGSSDRPGTSPRSGCEKCDCEIKNSSDTEARDAIAVPAPDLTLAGPLLTGETVHKPSAPFVSNHFAKRAPPHPGVPAYILHASLLN